MEYHKKISRYRPVSDYFNNSLSNPDDEDVMPENSDSGLDDYLSSSTSSETYFVSPSSETNNVRRKRKLKWKPLSKDYLGFICKSNVDDSLPEMNDSSDFDTSSNGLLDDLESHLSSLCPNYTEFNFDCIVYSNDFSETKLWTYESSVQCKSSNSYNDIEALLEIYETNDNNTDIFVAGSVSRLRRKKKWRKTKVHIAIKTNHIRDFRHNDGKNIFVNHRIYKALNNQGDENDEFYRRRHFLPSPKESPSSDHAVQLQIKSKCRNHYNRKQSRLENQENMVMAPHQLVEDNAPEDLSDEMITLLIELQYRDTSPEDYDLLCQLDDRVAPKTVSNDIIDTLKISVVSSKDLESDGAHCAVCMELYEEDEVIKHLPCGHFFHQYCIDQWLTNSSTNCPLDATPIL